ncbi:Hint domain-containing protein [Roseomonas sp. HJA6]|uniref:Hint domain-containing protein n=1 Tax=Roseomonas alba TaxID=2846776 RepID=A0ABS7A4L0_9PROT|nr:Hint domain-containing protein [Neoroseomonas alba]MBW6397239.1 Hint domain-containing protein [Neoroseomonas alba]
MAVLTATLGMINPQPQPGQNGQPGTPVTHLSSVQVNYSVSGPAPVSSGTVTLFAQRADGSVVQVAQAPIRTDITSDTVNFNNVDLYDVGDTDGVRFYAEVTEGASTLDTDVSSMAWNVDGNDAVCFLAATRIRTPEGERAVEELHIGDHILTADGRAETIRFIGRQTYSTRFADRETLYPVRIRAGALAEGVPAADLWVSPHHALHIDGVLVFAKALVNGDTIAQVAPPAEVFTYYNLELDAHEVIVAEGAEVESFADNVPRTRFHNFAEFAALFPEGREVGEMDVPVVKSVRQVPAATRERILRRAAELASQFVRAA